MQISVTAARSLASKSPSAAPIAQHTRTSSRSAPSLPLIFAIFFNASARPIVASNSNLATVALNEAMTSSILKTLSSSEFCM